MQDIPNITTLYISQANVEFGKQVVGLESEAMELMQQFGWPQNLAQFKRVIRQLIISTNDYYIKTDVVRQALSQESPSSQYTFQLQPGYEILNLNQNLDSINYDVSRIVLEQEHMNNCLLYTSNPAAARPLSAAQNHDHPSNGWFALGL